MFPAFGDKRWRGLGFPTPVLIPEDTACRTLQIPADGAWQAVVMGALTTLTLPENWQQFEGGITPDEAADRALQIVWDAYENLQCAGTTIAPYWDDADGGDADGDDEEFPWYEELADWAVTAFLAVSFTPAAAIEFVTIARKIRLAFRTRNYGAIFNIFVDGDLVGTGDTYSASPGMLEVDLDLEALAGAAPDHTFRIEHTGTHNAAAVALGDEGYGLEVIRKRLVEEEVSGITDIRQVAASGQLQMQRGGLPTWENVPTADNVRKDGTVIMPDTLKFATGILTGFVGIPTGGSAMELAASSNHPVLIRANGLRRVTINSDGRVCIATTSNLLGQFTVIDGSASRIGLVVQAAASQTANLQEWQSSAAVIQARIDAAGKALFRDEMRVQGLSSTTMRDMALFAAGWLTSTDATRKSYFTLSAYDNTAAREVLRGGTNGSAALIGALGAAPVARQIVTGSRQANPALASFLAGMALEGFIQNDTTEGEAAAFMLRQNPANSCQLQQSTNGVDWTLAFDFSLCIPPAIGGIIEIIGGGITIINVWQPSFTWVSDVDDTDERKEQRTQALCYASTAIVNGMMDAAYQAALGNITQETLVAIALGIIATLLLAFDILTLGALTPIMLAVTSAALAALAAIQTLDADVWLDTGVRGDMACLMFQTLMNQSVSVASFQSAFDNADCLSADDQDVAAILKQMLANAGTAQKLFDEFKNIVGAATAAAIDGILGASCVCSEATFCYLWDFGADGMERWQINVGSYVAGCGAKGTTGDDAPTCIGTGTGMEIEFTFYVPDGSEITQFNAWWGGDGIQEHPFWVDGVCDDSAWFNEASHAAHAVSIGAGTHTVRLVNVTNAFNAVYRGFAFEGTGVNPFGGQCDNCDHDPAGCVS